MVLIAHRGLISGPDPEIENSPELIETSATIHNFFVECDLWYKSNKLWLGHDKPQYQISENWLNDIRSTLFIHAKNLEAARFLSSSKKYTWFFHDQEAFTFTSHGHLWQYPGNHAENVILNQPERTAKLQTMSDEQIVEHLNLLNNNLNYIGVCSKYVLRLRDCFND